MIYEEDKNKYNNITYVKTVHSKHPLTRARIWQSVLPESANVQINRSLGNFTNHTEKLWKKISIYPSHSTSYIFIIKIALHLGLLLLFWSEITLNDPLWYPLWSFMIPQWYPFCLHIKKTFGNLQLRATAHYELTIYY